MRQAAPAQVDGSPAAPSTGAVRPVPASSRRLAAAAAAVAVVVHLWGLYRDHGPPTPRWFPQADKLEHLVGFGLPCFLVLLAVHLQVLASGRRPRARTVGLVVGLFAVHAVVSEILQGTLYTTRTGDPYDALADLAGTLLGLLAHLVVVRRRVRPVGRPPEGDAGRGGS